MKLVARHGGREVDVQVEPAAHGYRIQIGDATYDVDVAHVGGSVLSLLLEGQQHEISVRPGDNGSYRVGRTGSAETVELIDPLRHLAEQTSGAGGGGARKVEAYMPGVVKRVLVAEGDTVEPGQGLAVLEAMKMENEIEAEVGGVITKVLVTDGQAVDGGDPLFEIG